MNCPEAFLEEHRNQALQELHFRAELKHYNTYTMSSLINKVKDAVHSDKKDNSATDNPKSSNAGPHGSNIANKVDPRVDSDRDNYGSGVGGAGTTSQNYNQGVGPGSNNQSSYGGPGNPQSGNAGPHSSNLANKADPRVDSDLDGGRNIGGNNYGSSNTGAGYGNTGGVGGGYGGNQTAGPHSSNLANKADPRVDSDLDGGRNLGGNQGYGNQGYGGNQTAGPHSSNLANKADPRVDSDLVSASSPTNFQTKANNAQDGGRNAGFGTSGTGHASNTGYGQGAGGYDQSATPGSGNASKTAGPHNSNLLNKMDPRVDSDQSGGKTYGGDQTYR
jgi:hypothetical protein